MGQLNQPEEWGLDNEPISAIQKAKHMDTCQRIKRLMLVEMSARTGEPTYRYVFARWMKERKFTDKDRGRHICQQMSFKQCLPTTSESAEPSNSMRMMTELMRRDKHRKKKELVAKASRFSSAMKLGFGPSSPFHLLLPGLMLCYSPFR